jgi:hypothetical protein
MNIYFIITKWEMKNMNEILVRKHMKQVMKYGISKHMAKEITETAFLTVKGNSESLEAYISYAINLVYGMNRNTTVNCK